MNPHPRIEGVGLLEAFVQDPPSLFDSLQRTSTWDTRMRARLTASVGAPYNYSGITYPHVPMPPELDTLARRIEREVQHRITNCLINFYPEGASSMGFHSDSYEHLQPGTTVSIVSLGGPRTLRFRRKEARDELVDVSLGSGSLLVMRQRVQDEWMHALPPEPEAPPRMSLTFRWVL
ncbi:alpha-ketoglutarate-dependent dioxygenase AlkB [Vitiosangium sp. GDMCC 1.1324]|uniref:alpha-ketoglutarate-dependent dioxygenase AlkB n=1 Tax=Vitiosangium sp. (strain GDMCC 1.1324) TaxID=2138576 RepID=UPI000D37E0FD|nr:alpha-ketoglutarate-dependent dioxygenase AlkB [Vitiosangium sp. GDMCC 1.1324]PTL85761.1 alpha-ketoglutarate-dependent dioxygenase AlkB [Vitiosangium sp. GDMCC 1.1324]